MAPGNLGNKGSRSKHGARAYYKGRYHIAFYQETEGDEVFYIGFDNVADICRYLGWGTSPKAMKRAYLALYKCLYGADDPHTKLIDGVKLKPYLIDMSEEIEEDERRQRDMKRFVKINSTINVEVYPDLDAIDTTNEAAPMADRLSAKPNWVFPILIREGIHYYPSAIKEWKSVKSLEKHSKLSVSEEVDSIPDDERAACDKWEAWIKKLNARKSSKKEPAKKPADKPAKPE